MSQKEEPASRIPRLLSKNLPPVGRADLPDVRPLRAIIGPGVILVATSVGSGEMYFWPGITMKYGFALLWPALIALSLQYVLNTEFARYTIATGETVISGFARLWKPLAWVFLLCSTLPWLWPGWSTGGAVALSWIFGGRPEVISAVSLMVIGIALTGTRVVYRTVERVETVLIVYVVVVVAIVAAAVVRGSTLSALGQGLVTLPSIPEGLNPATLLAALAFCGAGGSVNLATSHWIRDKGFGMSARVPKVTSPLTGTQVSVSSTGYFFSPTPENLARWKAWWRVTRQEQSITFLLVGGTTLLLLMLVSHAVLHGADLPIGMEMLRVEGTRIGGDSLWVTTCFYIVVAAVFFTSAVGALDHVARIVSDILKANVPLIRSSANPFRSESALYFYVLWAMIVFAVCVLFVADLRDAPTLLRIAGSLSGVVMFLYSALTIPLMHRLAKDVEAADAGFRQENPFRLSKWRVAAVAVATLFYGGFSVFLIWDLL